MAEVVYVLCTIASLVAAALLLRSYRRTRSRLLMWSTCCFIGLAINNILLLVDLVVVPDVDLRFVRSGAAVVALGMLVVGLVWEDR
jgi:hypothetical protein